MHYIVISDFTNERVDVYNSINLSISCKTKEAAIEFANKSFENYIANLSDRDSLDHQDAIKVDTDSYPDYVGCYLDPGPDYIIGEAIDSGYDYHMYYMVFGVAEE